MKQTIKCIIAGIAAMLMAVVAGAQVTTSSLNGYVADETGAPLTGAAIIAVHTPSGTQYATIANESGRFNINGMRAGGPYKVEVSFLGMATVEYNDLYLMLGEPQDLNVKMQSSNELDAVVLTADASFDATRTGAGSNFNLSTIESMPTMDRSIYDVVKFTPQASVSKGGGISFAGSNNRYNSFQIDGAVSNDAFGLASSGTNGGQTGANPISLDAIEEIQVVVAPFDVRQSGFTGGAMNAITKSGTNTVKGSFYTYFNNQDFAGTTAGKMNPGQERKKLDQQLSQTYGFTVGAPIIKNKLFIFASAEYFKEYHPNIYSPSNGSYDTIDLGADVILADGTNLGNHFNPAMAQAFIDHYEDLFGINAQESFAPRGTAQQSLNLMARIDWNINDNNKLMIRYQHVNASDEKYSSGKYGYYFNNSSYTMTDRTNSIVAELNSRISDIVSNEFRATAVFVRDRREVPPGRPLVNVDSTFDVYLGTEKSSGLNSMNSDTFTLSDNVSIFLGNHNITVGTHNEFFRFFNVFRQHAFGTYTYGSIQDFFDNKPKKYEYRYADPAIEGVDNTEWGATNMAAQFGVYAQDEWKPTTNFTLTYGLRLDMPVMLNKPMANEEFNSSAIAQNTKEYVGVVPKPTVLFSPRVGFRWFIDAERRSLLRGGAGLFTGRVPFVWLSNAYNNSGMEVKGLTVTNPGADFPFTANPYVDVVEKGLGKQGLATVNTLSESFKYPQVFRVNLGYEQTFGEGWKFTFDGLFSKTLNNVFFENLALTKTGSVYAVNADAANAGNVAPYYTGDKTYYAAIALKNTNKGYTYSLSGQIQKHFEFGLDLMASYTFGHAFSVNDGTSSVAASNWQYNYSVDSNSPELGYSIFDKPHKVMAVVSYTTPTYLNGLQTSISLTYTGESGQRHPYTISDGAGDMNGDGASDNMLLYIPTQEELGQMSWANPADAVKFEQYIRADKYLSTHRGQWSERYAGIAPFEHHFDLHIAQDFYYDKKHGRKLQFTADFMNIGNLINREWGINWNTTYNIQVLKTTALTPDGKGNYTPTYKFEPTTLSISDFYSRWRCQLGFRLTF